MLKTIAISLVCCLVACGSGTDDHQAEIDACTERGIAYFKEIGSYPTLAAEMYKGMSADSVARARCERTITAF